MQSLFLLFLFKSPISWIFIAYILAYDLRLLHSDNFFDSIAVNGTSILTHILHKTNIVHYIHLRIEGGAFGKIAIFSPVILW